MCRRNTEDPLLRTFFDKYNLHLLSIPRANTAVGDLYIHDGEHTSASGSVTHFLEPALKIPAGAADEQMADVSGQISQAVSVKAGFGLLESFLTALGAAGIVTKARAGLEAKGAATLRFRFKGATRDSVDAMLLGSKLARHTLKKNHALYRKDYRYYLVTAVVRSPSISIVAESNRARAVDLDVKALKSGAKAAVRVEQSDKGEVTFAGKKKLAFGVELYELVLDPERHTLKLRLPPGVVRVRTVAGPAAAPAVAPAVIGGPDANAFLEIH
jgi:hypothetical protein